MENEKKRRVRIGRRDVAVQRSTIGIYCRQFTPLLLTKPLFDIGRVYLLWTTAFLKSPNFVPSRDEKKILKK